MLSTHELGRKIYNFRCYFCHGYSGNAQTLAATFFGSKPRDFTATPIASLSRETMISAVTQGKAGTAMMSFKDVLSPAEIGAVVDFVRNEFMTAARANTRYHTPENGWPNHERYSAAFPFAQGQIPLDTPWNALTDEQRVGKGIFLASCISCHDRSRVTEEGAIWESRPLSYPRNDYSHKAEKVDAISGASAYAVHDRAPQLNGLTPQQREGERLFQSNCAFCHAPDGTGRNWIGSFLESHPRDLTSARVAAMSDAHLREVIANGLTGTTMPAWKSVLSPQQIEAIVAYIDQAFITPQRGAGK